MYFIIKKKRKEQQVARTAIKSPSNTYMYLYTLVSLFVLFSD